MSKQLKLKFKKILKKAEFVQADLEYHQGLIGEAKQLFGNEVQNLISKLSPEDQKKLEEIKNKQITQQGVHVTEGEADEEDPLIPLEEIETMALVLSESDSSEEGPAESPPKHKSLELKKLFRRIAEQTHPDKVRASGFSEPEVDRLERVFKKASKAYKNHNWYMLYTIALELDLKIDDPSKDHIKWVEEDIHNTMQTISAISALIVWVWYNGDERDKRYAMKIYFQQAYQINYPGL